MIQRLSPCWGKASFAAVAALAWLSASLMSCPQVIVRSVPNVGVEINATIPSLGSIEDDHHEFQDDREFQDDELELCGLPGVWLVSPFALTLSQIALPQCVALSNSDAGAPSALLIEASALFAEP